MKIRTVWLALAASVSLVVFASNLFAQSSPGTRPVYQGLKITGSNAAIQINKSGVADKADGTRGPLFVWSNPGATSPAGQNAGLQVWVGNNPTATPGANQTVNTTLSTTTGNNRDNLSGLNIIVQATVNNAGAGYVDSFIRGAEIEVGTIFTRTVTDPFGGGLRKNGLELVAQDASGGANSGPTAATVIWAVDTVGNSWWYVGHAISRVQNTGVLFQADPGGVSDGTAAFANAAIHDNSNSATSYKVSGSHGIGVDLSGGTYSTAQLKFSSGLLYQNSVWNGTFFRATYNSSSVPGAGAGWASSWNFSGGSAETVFWNTDSSATSSFDFRQVTGTGTSSRLLSLALTGSGLSTPLAVTSTSASALAVGRQGATDPVLKIDASTASVATGISITGAAAAGGVAIAAISSGTNENLTIDAKGSGTITLGGTSTGTIALNRAVAAAGLIAASAGPIVSGHTASQTAASVTYALQGTGTGTGAGALLSRFSNDATGPILVFAKSRGTTIASQVAVQVDDVIGEYIFYGSNGSGYNQAAGITARVDGTPGSNDMPGRLVFTTTPDGSGTPVINLTIKENGAIIAAKEVRIGGDIGGQASHNTFTNVSDVSANSTGVGAIKFKGTTNRDSTGFIKIYIGTTPYYIPVFSAISG